MTRSATEARSRASAASTCAARERSWPDAIPVSVRPGEGDVEEDRKDVRVDWAGDALGAKDV